MSTTSENLRAIDGYLNTLWEQATKLRDQHTGQAHADLNNLRHGIGAIPDGLLEAAKRIAELERENARLREALFQTHLDLVAYADIEVARKRLVERRAALAGSGEK